MLVIEIDVATYAQTSTPATKSGNVTRVKSPAVNPHAGEQQPGREQGNDPRMAAQPANHRRGLSVDCQVERVGEPRRVNGMGSKEDQRGGAEHDSKESGRGRVQLRNASPQHL